MDRRNFLTLPTATVGAVAAIGAFPPTLSAFESKPFVKIRPGFKHIATFHDEITALCEYEGSIFVATGMKVYRLNKETRRVSLL